MTTAAAFTATAYAELVTKYPQAAGAALYANKAYGRPFLTLRGRLRGHVLGRLLGRHAGDRVRRRLPRAVVGPIREIDPAKLMD
jgi:hypothetical protein